MKICSLLPSATEILFALGLGEAVVGVSHECDFPPEARRKRCVIRSVLVPERHSSVAIDAAVREHAARHASLYELDVEALRELRPDVIVTQELCGVCAIETRDVLRAIEALPGSPTVLSVHPHTISEMLDDIRCLGEALGRPGQAAHVIEDCQARIERVRRRMGGVTARPRVACLEWLDPLMFAGHWVPEMVGLAGGCDLLGASGEPSGYVEWERLRRAQPEVLVLLPCGLPMERARRELASLEALAGWEDLPAVRQRRVWLVDGPAYFNRSGPRLVDGVELLAHLFHPGVWGERIPSGAAERVPG